MMTPAELGIAAARQQAQDIDRYGVMCVAVRDRRVRWGWAVSVTVEDADGQRASGTAVDSDYGAAYERAMIRASERVEVCEVRS